MDVPSAPSRGERMKQCGERRRLRRWNLRQPRRPIWAWSSSQRPATTIPATAEQLPRTSMCPHPVRTWWAAVELTRRRPKRLCGTTTPERPTAKEPAADTQPSFLRRAFRLARRNRRREAPPREEWFPTSRATPTPTPATTSSCTDRHTVVGGTSAVAPLYAGLFAAFGSKLGFVSPVLWKNPTGLSRHHDRGKRALQRCARA